jgi:predicted HAD superfamily Cof-like phosphohydrolase
MKNTNQFPNENQFLNEDELNIWQDQTIQRLINQDRLHFITEVETFNRIFGKLNNYTPTIPEKMERDFIYNFIQEELDEYKVAADDGDIIGVMDAFCDIMYVLSAGIMAYGLKDKFLAAYNEVQQSNLSKSCATEEEADATAKFRAAASQRPCHFEKRGDKYVVYRSEDRKVQKSLSYFAPNLKQFFTEDELKNAKR